jgi:carbonyl reductase 1
MMTEFLPLIRPGGRLLNLASSDGQLMPYSEPLKLAFIDASKSSIEACTSLMNRFTTEVMTDKEELEGWPSIAYAYAVSKCGVIASTKAMAVETKKNGQELLINACCPGFVNTDMTHGHGVLTVDEGAKTPVLLALGDLGGVSGGFWKEGSLIEWCPSMGI